MNFWNQKYTVKASTTKALVCWVFIFFLCLLFTCLVLSLVEKIPDFSEYRLVYELITVVCILGFGFVCGRVGTQAGMFIGIQKAHDAFLAKKRETQSAPLQALEHHAETLIDSQIFSELQRAVADFPSRYPDHSTRPPKLDDDIRPWLKSVGYAKNDREAFVFGSILSEHFKL